MKEFGIKNAIVKDPYNYSWMFHQIIKEVSFEERKKIMEEKFDIER
jgi:PhnB protein